jgi:hypothetical protein
MTYQEYQELLHNYAQAGQALDYVRSDRQNLCLPLEERPSDEELHKAEDDFAELVRIVNSVQAGLVRLID